MRRLPILATLIVVLGALLLSGISDGSPSIADTSIPDNETATSVNQTDSATATITITMRTPPLPEE